MDTDHSFPTSLSPYHYVSIFITFIGANIFWPVLKSFSLIVALQIIIILVCSWEELRLAKSSYDLLKNTEPDRITQKNQGDISFNMLKEILTDPPLLEHLNYNSFCFCIRKERKCP